MIGSGSTAFSAAIQASESGRKVALVESNVVGGTCVNVGCVPSKAMLAPADLFQRAAHHRFAGIDTAARGFDLAKMVDSKAALVDQLRQTGLAAEVCQGSSCSAGRQPDRGAQLLKAVTQ